MTTPAPAIASNIGLIGSGVPGPVGVSDGVVVSAGSLVVGGLSG